MTTKEKIEEIEGKFDVENITVEKYGKTFQIYPWLKGRLFHQAITGVESMQRKTFSLLIKQVRSLAYGSWNLFKKNEIWAFSNSAERRLIDDKYYDKLFDYIGNEGKRKTLIIELRLFHYYSYRKVASKRVVSKSVFMLLEEVYARLVLRMPEINNEDELNRLNSEFDSGVSQKEIIKKYLAQYKMMRFWLKILPNPKVVYMSVGYINFGYIRAFKEKGIKVVEFQHGLMTKNHNGFYYKKPFDPVQFPDEILTVGESEVDVYDDENSFPVKNIKPIGSYILDYYSSKDKASKFSSPPKFLFAMQDGVIGDKFAEFIVELTSNKDLKAEIIIQTRRTPAEEYISKFPELKDVEFSTDNFYSALLKCDVHVTVYSTTAVEALSLGRQNILVNLDNLAKEQLSSKLGTNEYTTIVDDVSSFVIAANGIKEVDKQVIKASNSNNVKPDFRKNIFKVLKEIE